jgi:signal transduction histidine kinase
MELGSQRTILRRYLLFSSLHTDEEYEGTGIGLAIAQKIVHQHGGSIWVESELEKGANFCFTVPLEPQKSE